MSADNGVYILETGTTKKEWRVREMQAVDNIAYDDTIPQPAHCPNHNVGSSEHDPWECPLCVAYEKRYNSDDPDVHIKNAREMWVGCQVFTDKNAAILEAHRQYEACMKDFGICEYGVSTIEVPRDF